MTQYDKFEKKTFKEKYFDFDLVLIKLKYTIIIN